MELFECEMIRSSDDFLLPLLQICRLEDKENYIRGVMLPLEIQDIYFLMGILIHGIQEAIHLFLDRRRTLELLANHHYGGSLDAISEGYLNI